MKRKLTISAKKRITNEWSREFPSLSIYKPLWLIRRVGLFIQGICLDRDSGNDNYLPTFHLHNLAGLNKDFISLTLRTPLRTERTNYPDRITLADHEKRFKEIATRFRNQSPLKFEGNLSCDDVIFAYQNHIVNGKASTAYPLNLFYDMVCIYIWCNRFDDAYQLFQECWNQIKMWPDRVTRYISERLSAFLQLESCIGKPLALQDGVKNTIHELGLETITVADLR